MSARIAMFVRDVSPVNGVSVQRLYRCEPPYPARECGECGRPNAPHAYVVVSAASPCGEPETYLFASALDGEIHDWSELRGSQRGTLDHEQVLRDAGYEVRP